MMLTFVTIGQGKIALRGKPGRKFYEALPYLDCSRVVTLLSEHEGGLEVGEQVKERGVQWTWIPLEDGKYPLREAYARLRDGMIGLSDNLDKGESLMIHCAAGIHRTGMLTYGLLRYRGYSTDDAMRMIAQMRQHTHDGLQAKQMKWGEDVVRELMQSE
jgi:protein-tyrosine phosphatase